MSKWSMTKPWTNDGWIKMRAEAPTKPGMYWIKYRRRTLIHTDMAELKISYLGRIWYLDGKMIDEIDIREWKPFWEEAGG